MKGSRFRKSQRKQTEYILQNIQNLMSPQESSQGGQQASFEQYLSNTYFLMSIRKNWAKENSDFLSKNLQQAQKQIYYSTKKAKG